MELLEVQYEKKCYHFFGGLLNAQANWLNKMSEKGYRLIRAGKMLYEFEECKPNEVKYCVEFIGEKSKENAKDYSLFLEDMGYKVFFKNINLNYSVGKVRCVHGLKKADALRPTLQPSTVNC